MNYNKTFQVWKYLNDPDFIAIQCDQYRVYKGTNSLITIDDWAIGQDVKNRTSELLKLAFSARHYNLSIIVITQQLTTISKHYRENISKLITLYNPSRNDVTTKIHDYLYRVEKDEINTIIEKLKNNKYARLEDIHIITKLLFRKNKTYVII